MIGMKIKTTKEYESFKGFTLKENMIYGDVNGQPMVISSIPYSYQESTDEIHLWILDGSNWVLQYIDSTILKDEIIDLYGYQVYVLEFIKAMQWTREPDELEYIYFNSPLPPVVITACRGMFNLFTIEEIFEM